MTVIAWDGTTLAADKRCVAGSTIKTTTKIWRVGELLVGIAGDLSFGMEMLDWIKQGRNPSDFPKNQRTYEDFVSVLVVDENGQAWVYERSPHPFMIEDACTAIGTGRDFALAAMYCGKTAAEAVAIACRLDNGCGNGVNTLNYMTRQELDKAIQDFNTLIGLESAFREENIA